MIDAALLIIAKMLAGWLIADLLGGIVHWLQDRVLTERTPVFGTAVIAANRRHHRDPMAFVAGGVWRRNSTTWLAAAIGAIVWLALAGPSLIWIAATTGAALSSSVHFLAHQPRRAHRVIRVLQDIGLVQSTAHHAGHHRAPSDRRYCPLTGWINPVLDSIGLWSRLEAVLRKMGVAIEAEA